MQPQKTIADLLEMISELKERNIEQHNHYDEDKVLLQKERIEDFRGEQHYFNK